jgi:hypothetical protein
MGIVATIAFVTGSTWTIAFWPTRPTQMLSDPAATNSGLTPTAIVRTTWLVAGSIWASSPL